ncbi:MAG: LysR family transcriptional regulator [Streptosporangiales bacterium]
MLNLERLRILHAVSAYGSINAAADALHVTSSAASQQLTKLEREVGERLLVRRGRGVRLTDAGERLAGHAAGILSQLAEAESDLEAHRDTVIGKVTVAAFATTARGLAPAALGLLAEAHPQLEVCVVEQEPEASVADLDRGDVDVGLLMDWENSPLSVPDSLQRTLLMDDPADLAIPAGHRCAGRSSVPLTEVAGGPWISWPCSGAGGSCHDWLLHTLRSQGIEPTVTHRVEEHATQLALVAAGLGTAITPRLGRGRPPEGVVMVGVQPTLSRRIYAAWRKDTARRPGVRAVVDAFRTVAADASAAEPTAA